MACGPHFWSLRFCELPFQQMADIFRRFRRRDILNILFRIIGYVFYNGFHSFDSTNASNMCRRWKKKVFNYGRMYIFCHFWSTRRQCLSYSYFIRYIDSGEDWGLDDATTISCSEAPKYFWITRRESQNR